MIDTLVIVVYNRYENLVKWFHILKQCENVRQVVVIHNTEYGIGEERYCNLCLENEAIYISRKNIGFDIGAFQDVCMDRLFKFPYWDQLLWCTDDIFPMQKDFLNYFALQPGEGVRCMEISPYVRKHIRTTGFSISRETASRLKFPVDPIITKQHCYHFEHRGKESIFHDQIRKMGLNVVMVAPRESSPMFDTGYHRRLDRDKELNDKWITEDGPAELTEFQQILSNAFRANIAKPTITVICPIFNSYPEIISSLICQTFKDWELLLIHDGPNETGLKDLIEAINDDRIKYIETDERRGNWGHNYRAEYIQKAEGEYTLITNADNHLVPVFFEYMLKGFVNGVVAVYCESMVHSYKGWGVIPCMLKRGYLDCSGVLVKTSAAKQVGWNNTTEHSADWIYFQDLINKFGVRSFNKVRGCLLIHN